MYIYAGIDEAGYGPMFGPLLVARMVMAIPQLPADSSPPQLWNRLSKAVCRDRTRRKGRIAVNDSKKLHMSAKAHGSKPGVGPGAGVGRAEGALDAAYDYAAIQHLEPGVLAFAALGGRRCATLFDWLEAVGESCHRDLGHLPWYAATEDRPWQKLPCSCTEGEMAVACSMLTATARRIGVEVVDLGAAVVFEDRFNRMAGATRSKASASFTFVCGHLRAIWDRFGKDGPNVVVDRQSGRMHYREPLAQAFPEADFVVLEETPQRSAYRLTGAGREMQISFEVDSEMRHMPVALASMISKYTRELLMARFQAWFLGHAPHIRPTAGYATDGKRFLTEISPLLPALGIELGRLVRSC
jgi:ribonuclease HII